MEGMGESVDIVREGLESAREVVEGVGGYEGRCGKHEERCEG